MFFEVKLFWYIDLTRFYEKEMEMGYEEYHDFSFLHALEYLENQWNRKSIIEKRTKTHLMDIVYNKKWQVCCEK